MTRIGIGLLSRDGSVSFRAAHGRLSRRSGSCTGPARGRGCPRPRRRSAGGGAGRDRSDVLACNPAFYLQATRRRVDDARGGPSRGAVSLSEPRRTLCRRQSRYRRGDRRTTLSLRNRRARERSAPVGPLQPSAHRSHAACRNCVWSSACCVAMRRRAIPASSPRSSRTTAGNVSLNSWRRRRSERRPVAEAALSCVRRRWSSSQRYADIGKLISTAEPSHRGRRQNGPTPKCRRWVMS